MISAFETKFPDVPSPNKTTIMRMVKNFRNGIFENRTCNRLKNVLTPEKLSEIKSKFEANGQTSVREVSSQIRVSRMSVHRATRMLKLKPYKVNVAQELLPADSLKRVAFWQWLLDEFNGNTNIGKFDNFFFSDEEWFTLDGYINSQLYRV